MPTGNIVSACLSIGLPTTGICESIGSTLSHGEIQSIGMQNTATNIDVDAENKAPFAP